VNLVVAIIVLGGSALAAWSGLTDPEGGALGALGRALRGEPQPARKTPPTAASLISSSGLSASSLVDSSGPGGSAGKTTPVSGARAAVTDEARAQLGKPYRLGGNGPAVFDCSGLSRWCMRKGGKELPRTAAQQQMSPLGTNVPIAQAQPGDLIFYGFPAVHVAIYVGNGNVISAPRPGKKVMVVPLKDAGWPNPPNSARDFLSTPLAGPK
jgi:cell wall-associated NlpC family hydrolase